MNELTRIFSTNPSLLEAKEVKELIEYCQVVHKKNLMVGKRAIVYVDKFESIIMNSDRFIIGGSDANDTIDKLVELFNDNC